MKLPHSLLPLLLLVLIPRTGVASPFPHPFKQRQAPALTPFAWQVADAKDPPAPQQKQSEGGAVQEGGQCQDDDDCAAGTYCDKGTCVKVTYPFHIPPYLFYRSYDGRFTEILGIYWHQRGTEGYQVVFPFYWHFWSKDDESRAVLPFYYNYWAPKQGIRSTFYTLFQYRRTPNERNYRLWPIVFWTDYGEKGAGLTIMPLFHFAREGTRTAAFLPFLLSGFDRDPKRGYSRGLAAGIYYWHRDEEKHLRADAVFPIFYRSRGEDEAFTWVLPLNFHWRRGGDRTLLFLPFFYQGKTPERTTTVSLVPPLYHYRRGESSRLFALPMIYHSRDGDRSFFLGGPFYYSGWKDGHSFGMFPLLFTKDSKLTGYRVLFPVFWQFYSRYHNFTVAGPVFYRRRGARTTAGVVPLFLHHRDREKGTSFTTLFPLFYYGTAEHGRRSHVVSPLFLYERDDPAKVTQWGLIAPPFYRRRDADREVDALIPLALRWHDKVDEATTWVLGPTVFYSDPAGGTQIFFPFFWRFSDARSGAATSILFPFGYRHRRPDGTHSNLFFPFYYRRDRDGWSARILPLLYLGRNGEQRHAVLFPALWHVKSSVATTTLIGPAYLRTKHKGGWHAGLFPALFAGSEQGERYGVIFPAFWYLSSEKESYTTYVAGSAFYSRGKNGRVFGLLPVFAAGTWKGTHFQAVLPPLFYRSANPAQGKAFTLAGPYLGWRKPGETGHAVFPLAYFRWSKQDSVAMTLPLFYYRDRPEGQLLVTPVGGYRRRHKEGVFQGILGPYVWHRSPRTRGFAILPIFYRWTRPEEQSTTTVVFPLGVRHSSPKASALVWFPFLWHYRDPTQRTLVIFPVYWRVRQHTKTPETDLQADVVFPLYIGLRQPRKGLQVVGPGFWARSNDWSTAGLVPIFLYRKNPRGSSLYSLPFIYYRRDEESRTRTWVVGPFYRRRYAQGTANGLLPVFYHKDTPKSRYTVLAPLFWDFGDPVQGKRTVVAGPLVYRRTPGKKAVGLAPLFYHAWEDSGARSTAILPLFYQRSEPSRFAIYTPLFGYDRSRERTQWYAGVYFRRHSPASSLDIAFPLFLRHRNHVEGRTSLVIPPYYGRWSKERSFHLAFPIFWRQRRIDSSATVLFPFLWDFNDRYASRTTIVFPALLYHRDQAAKSTSILTPPGLWLRFRPKATDAVLFPIVWHFAGQTRGSTVVFPLYWDFRRGPRRYTTLFPVYWDFRYPKEQYTLLLPLLYRYDGPTHRKWWVLNTWYTRDKRDDTYGLYVFPLFFSQRKRPGDLKWEALLGLFGYERIGRNRLMTLFFYTFPLEPEPAAKGERPPKPAPTKNTKNEQRQKKAPGKR